MPDPPSHPHQPADEALKSLAIQALAGDYAAFEAIYRRLHGGLQRFLLRRLANSSDLAEELAQRAWVEVWRAFQEQRYDPDQSAVTTYIYAVGYKIWLQHCRRQRISPRMAEITSDPALGLLSDRSDAAAVMHAAELLDAVRELLQDRGRPDGLTEDDCRILLAFAGGESDRSLANQLGIAPSTANARKNAALAKLRRLLAGRGFTSRE